jgi:predicted HTH transcriptional regulator
LDASLQTPRQELNEIDWKAQLSDDKKRLTEHLCAMANHPGGGYLVFGINPNGERIGLSDEEAESIVNRLTSLARDAIEPPQVLKHAFDKQSVPSLLYIHLPESATKPVHLRGKNIDETFIRSGATTRKASRPEVGTLLLHSKTPKWEELYASNLIRPRDVSRLLDVQPLFSLMERPEPRNEAELLGWMEEQKFISSADHGEVYITNLGAISAARNLADFPELSRKASRVVIYKGVNKAKSVREQEGVRGYAIGFSGLLRFVTDALPQTEFIGRNGLRRMRTTYPQLALRELIANALIHQDFSISGAGPMIEIFDDRIDITNPGQLLPSKQLHRLIGTQPESRNELLARAFRLFRIVEERGSGLIKAGLEVEMHGLPPIQFVSESNYFRVSLFAPRKYAQMSQQERLDACYQHAVLRHFSSATMTNKSLRERLGMPEKQRTMVSALLQQALEQGLVKLADPDNKSRKFSEYVPFWA